jgi:hypothetical protein
VTNEAGCTSVPSSNVVIKSVSTEITANLVIGGGHIVLTSNSSGKYPGVSGSKMNFDLIVMSYDKVHKRKKIEKRLSGNINIFYRGTDGYNYQIKSDFINSLVADEVTEAGKTFKVATITATASLKRILPWGRWDVKGLNSSLIVKVWDSSDDKGGKYDRISVELMGVRGSGIYFSSNWSNSTNNTEDQELNGGNIYIGVIKQISDSDYVGINGSDLIDDTKSLQVSEFGIKAYPNPFSDHIYFDLQLKTDSKVCLEIYNINGSKVATVYDDVVTGFSRYRFEYVPENLTTGTFIYRLVVDGKLVFTGKLIHY